MKPTLRSRLASLALALASLVVALGIGEIAVRLTWGNPPELLDKSDPVLGSRYLQGERGVRTVDGRRVPIQINPAGFNSPDYPQRAPAGTQRLLFLGDSFTGATEVALPETFHQLAAAKLTQALGQPVQALNFGVSGYNTTQELLVYQTVGEQYDHQVVILCFFVGNDVFDNGVELSQSRVPHHTLDDAGQLMRLPFQPRWSRRDRWIRRSALYKWQKMVTNGLSHHYSYSAVHPRYEVYHEPTEPVWQQAWKITEKLLQKVRNEASQHGRQFLLVVIPERIQVSETDWQALLQQYPKMAERQWELLYPQRRLLGWASEQGLETLDLTPTFRAAASAEPLYNVEDPHLNPAGHRVAAKALAERLEGLGWLTEPSSTTPPDSAQSGFLDTPDPLR